MSVKNLDKGLTLDPAAEILLPEIFQSHPVPEHCVLGLGIGDHAVKVK